MAKLTPEALNELVSVYVGYFNRAPDPKGLQFYIDKLEAEPPTTDIETIATNFANSPEALGQYPYLATPGLSSTTAFITSIYQNLFNRAPDDAGLAYWEDKLDSGVRTPGEMILAIIKGAVGGDDKAIIDNKIAAALNFVTDAANTPGFEYDDAAHQQAKDTLSNITADEQSVTDAATATDAFLAGETTVGSTFTLTPDLDQFTGTAANDTFQGELGGDNNGFTSFDDLVGGAGQDTLNIVVAASGGASIPGTVDISGIEVINFDQSAEVSGDIDASVFVGAEQIWQIGDGEGEDADISNLAEGQTAGFRDIGVNGTVAAAAGAESMSIALDELASGSTFTLVGAAVTTVNVSGSVVDDNGTAQLNIGPLSDLEKLETINLALTSDVQINTFFEDAALAKTIDASASTGDLTFGVTDGDDDSLQTETLAFGSGDDSLSLFMANLGADAVSINGGAGKDTIHINITAGGEATTLSLTGGDDEDTFAFDFSVISGGGNITGDDDETVANLVTIEDFDAGSDLIQLSAYDDEDSFGDQFAAQNAVNLAVNGLASDATLVDALTAVEGVTALGEFAQFQFGGNTYLYHDVFGVDGVLDDDTVIEIVGLVTLNNDNVVGLDVA